VFDELAWVKVALPSPLADTYKVFNAVLPLLVVGINKITELPLIRASVKVDVVELAVKVILPVLFNLPLIVLFNDVETNLKCCPVSGIDKGTVGN
jgi:hypothetical protein